jgi:hypothetical protein
MLPEVVLHHASIQAMNHRVDQAYHRRLPIIQDIPQVDQDGTSNAGNGENTIDLGAPSARHENTSEDQPDPPLRREFANDTSS